LVELMISLAVLAIIMALALPSFADFAERSALRGAADNVIGVIANAKEEAIKRDRLVKVKATVVGSGFCIGASVVPTAAAAGCDCTTPANCPVAVYPAAAAELGAVTLDGAPAFGAGTDFVIDPKTGMLDDPVGQGNIDLQVPCGYKVRVAVNALGRPTLCTPSGKPLTAIGNCP